MSLQLVESTYRNKDWLKTEYISKERTLKDIAEQCQASKSTIQAWAIKFQLIKHPQNYHIDYKNKEWLRNQYVLMRKTKKQIADQQGVSERTIERWRCKFELRKMRY